MPLIPTYPNRSTINKQAEWIYFYVVFFAAKYSVGERKFVCFLRQEDGILFMLAE